MKRTTLFLSGFFIIGATFAQTNWSKVDFTKDYKGTFKIGGASVKSLKNNKTFVNSYRVSQATTMKGSENTATKSVFSEVSLAGIDNESFQQMVNELYKNMVSELESAGLQITKGDDVMETSFVKDRKEQGKKSEFIGPVGENTMYDGSKKISEGTMSGYGVFAVSNDVSFIPGDKIIYTSSNLITSGNFYQKLAAKENINLLSVAYYVTFASFDGGRGYKDIKLSTNPVISVSVSVALVTPNGAFNKIYYNKLPVWGSGDWSEGIVKGKDNKNTAELLGLARSAEYEINANSEKYLNEVKAIITNLQKDIVKGIKNSL